MAEHHPQHLCSPERALKLLDPTWRLIPDPRDLLSRLGIKAGWSAADLGCGPGFFTKPLLDLVGIDGHVTAVELQTEMLPLLHQHVGAAPNLTVAPGDMATTGLPAQGFDAVLIAFTLHEVSPPTVLAEVRRLLKPAGLLLALEWGEGPAGPPLSHRLLRPSLEELVAGAGLTVLDTGLLANGNQYWLRARS